jgi:hypothetical protein
MRSTPSSSSASRLTWPGPLTAGGKCASAEQHLEEHPGLDGEEKPARCLFDSAAIEALGAVSPFDFASAMVPEASAAAPPCYFVADKASHSAAASTSYCCSGSRMRDWPGPWRLTPASPSPRPGGVA